MWVLQTSFIFLVRVGKFHCPEQVVLSRLSSLGFQKQSFQSNLRPDTRAVPVVLVGAASGEEDALRSHPGPSCWCSAWPRRLSWAVPSGEEHARWITQLSSGQTLICHPLSVSGMNKAFLGTAILESAVTCYHYSVLSLAAFNRAIFPSFMISNFGKVIVRIFLFL